MWLLVRLKSKIDVQTAQEIREKDLDGINVDEDSKKGLSLLKTLLLRLLALPEKTIRV